MVSARVQSFLARGVLGASLLLLSGLSSACGAVYPEIATPVRPAASRQLEPPPPDDIVFIKFASAQIPNRTRDGRQWDSVGGSAPDPFAKLLIGDKDVVVTPVQANTLRPTWPDQRVGNYRLPRNVPVRVELWDANAINNHPICVESINNILAEASNEQNLEVRCESGAQIELTVQPAHAKFGVGLYYELRTAAIFVTRVVAESPAARAGLKRGDQLLKIQGKPVKDMDQDESRSLINSNVSTGVTLTVKHTTGAVDDVTLKDGPMYPTIEDEVKVD
jgi:membrane-associated protease RseP (regulator of RpoE activity)